MNSDLFLATENGLIVCSREGETWREAARGLEDHHITSVIARDGVILAGARDGVFRSDELGNTWEPASSGLEIRLVRWLGVHPQVSDLEFAGTEPAGIFVSHDGGGSWRSCPEVARLRDAHEWYLPYSPEAGAVRGFAFNGPRGYAAVEVGGVLVTDDRGENWRLAEGSNGEPDHHPRLGEIHPDVHSIEVHPTSPERVAAPTGGGFFYSEDGGRTWERRYPHCYCRAVWLDPEDAEHMVMGPADGVDRNGRIEETNDGGRSWKPANQGLQTPWPRHMVERFHQHGDELLAVLSNGELYAAPLESLRWQRVLPEVNGIRAVTAMEEVV